MTTVWHMYASKVNFGGEIKIVYLVKQNNKL